MKKCAMGLVVLLGLGFGWTAGAADFDGDGTGDIAVFSASVGLWSVRGITRLYMGSEGDVPVPGDYSGNGTDQAAIFRPSAGMWAVRDVTRVYLGNSTDQEQPGDYDGDRIFDIAVFRPSTGMWSVRNITRTYFGGSGVWSIGPNTVKAPKRVINPNSDAQSGGYYDGFILSQVDGDLNGENIIEGVEIFGVGGEFTCPEPDAPAPGKKVGGTGTK